MRPEDIQGVVSKWQSHIAVKGGQSRSERKREASRRNVVKARQAKAQKRLLGRKP